MKKRHKEFARQMGWLLLGVYTTIAAVGLSLAYAHNAAGANQPVAQGNDRGR